MEQPPLSRLIKAIERELGAQLFRRKPRGVELTEAGRAFLDKARAVLLSLEDAVQTTRSTARGEQGRICVGVTPTSPFHPFVPHAIRAFREAFPRVTVTLEEGLSNELFEHLRHERIDVAFVRSPPADPEGLAVFPLLEEALVVALPKGHVLAKGDGHAAIPLSALASEIFILMGGWSGLGLYAAMLAACRTAGFSPRVGPEAPRLASTLNLVAVGLGISFVPASLQRLQIDGVAYRRLKRPNQPKLPLQVASRRGDPSAVVGHFLSLARRAAKNFPTL